ncbi:unnamed protein product [Phaedon cochleariae]|uniref:U6 small nuclear RNA (adenine-(43)-N(6))-methyltransferase n=1 Tax=Phaedon cochleariae TaxID=80249 RepID=A0A9N9SB57_PHACE|nr:unnamed protein product [Phaedon cochleariae]
MAMNKYMHPRNIYKSPPNFKQLALDYPEFREFLKQDITGKVNIDFQNVKSLRALSCTLLKNDFGLEVEMPLNKLIPTIPLRLNYILWLEDLMSLTGKKEGVKGIDIGTGASCVYPLLAAKKNKWSMVATEVDKESISYARKNIERNNMQDLIEVTEVDKNTFLKIIAENGDYDFCMCNPPFFASTQELGSGMNTRNLSRPRPKNSFCASVNEVVVKGGEVDFISCLINESKEVGEAVKIYSTMVGHKKYLPQLKKLLREVQVTSFKETEFCQGNTTRWGLAWTFCQSLDLKKCPDPMKLVERKLKSKDPLCFKLPVVEINDLHFCSATDRLLDIFSSLQMSVEEVTRKNNIRRFFVSAFSNNWSNQRKKRREKNRKMNDSLDSVGEYSGSPSSEEHKLQSPRREDDNNSIDYDAKSPGKRTNHDHFEGAFIKKLKIIDNEPTIFFKFVATIKYDDYITLELDSFDNTYNRDYLHQILQYIKNNFQSSD